MDVMILGILSAGRLSCTLLIPRMAMTEDGPVNSATQLIFLVFELMIFGRLSTWRIQQ